MGRYLVVELLERAINFRWRRIWWWLWWWWCWRYDEGCGGTKFGDVFGEVSLYCWRVHWNLHRWCWNIFFSVRNMCDVWCVGWSVGDWLEVGGGSFLWNMFMCGFSCFMIFSSGEQWQSVMWRGRIFIKSELGSPQEKSKRSQNQKWFWIFLLSNENGNNQTPAFLFACWLAYPRPRTYILKKYTNLNLVISYRINDEKDKVTITTKITTANTKKGNRHIPHKKYEPFRIGNFRRITLFYGDELVRQRAPTGDTIASSSNQWSSHEW